MKKLSTFTFILSILLLGVSGVNSQSDDYKKYITKTTITEDGDTICTISVPGKPPDNYRAPIAYPTDASKTLVNVPAFDWSFGCSATSAAMIAGYYDNMGYPNMYTGPTNGGIMPMDNSSWPDVYINGEWRHQCPLSATRDGVDGRTTLGHVDDYWVSYLSGLPDPYIGNWTQHSYGDCTGDYMKTNQSAYSNDDGSTNFTYYTDGSALHWNSSSGWQSGDGMYGFKLFAESRGYTVVDAYTQLIDGLGNPYGFTFANFKAEIDAGRPVLIHISGHTMVGFGYNDSGNTVYLHDTWDYNDHSMTWGGSYGGSSQWGVTVLELQQSTINVWTGNDNHYWGNASNWSLGHIPTATEDVEIPNANMPCIVDFSDKTCKDLNIYSGATVRIYDQALTVNGDMTVNGSVEMLQTDATLNVYGSIVWESGSSANVTVYSAYMNIYGDWDFKSGSNVNMTNGFVDFEGSSTSWIRSYSSNAGFNNLRIYKSGGSYAGFSALSNNDVTVNNLTYINSASSLKSFSNYSVIFKGNISYYGSFDFSSGTAVFNGTSQDIHKYSTNDGIFNNVEFSSSTGTTTNADMVVKGDLTITQGYFDPQSHRVYIEGNWTNFVGDAGFDETGSRVVFNGSVSGHQYCTSEHFDTLEIAKVAGGAFRPFGGSAYNIVCEHYDWTAGAVDIITGGSTFTANDLIDNGIYGAFYLNPGGTINLTNTDGWIDLNGELHIFGGTMNVYGGTTDSYWPYGSNALISMSDGVLDFHDRGIFTYNSATYTLTENITGGVIRTTGGYLGYRADFTPGAGTFEFYGTTDYYISQHNGSTLYDVNIDKSAKSGNSSSAAGKPEIDERSGMVMGPGSKSNTIRLNSDCIVTNNLTVTSGELKLNGNELTVGHNCNVYGTLTMDNAADVLNVGSVQFDILTFNSGSFGNISAGTINLPYALFLDLGSSFVATTSNTLYFGNNLNFGGIYNGSTNTLFGNVIVDMLPGDKWILDNTSSAPFIVNGDFTVSANNVVEGQDQTLIIHGILTDNSNSVIYAYDAPVKGKSSIIEGSGNKVTGNPKGKSKGGYIELDNDFTLNGLLDVGDGDVVAHGLITEVASGTVTITGGSYSCDASSGFNSFSGAYNMSDGLMEFTASHVNFYGTPNLTGGTVRAGRTVGANDGGFQQNGGTFEFIGSTTGNYIQFAGNNYINDFLFNRTGNYAVYPQNYAPVFVIKGDVTINSGTFNSNGNDIEVGGNWTNSADASAFNETSGTVTFNDAGDINVSSETFFNLVLDKPSSGEWLTLTDDVVVLNDLNVNGGALHTASNILDVNGNATIDGGTLFVQAGGTLKVGDNKSLTSTLGSKFYIEGASGNYATLTHSGTGQYNTLLNGETAANYAVFEYMGANGIYISTNGTINPVYTFNHCIFQNGYEASSPLSAYLRLDSDNTFTSIGTHFEAPTGALDYNVWKTVGAGHATFQAATGDFAGAEFENDWANLVDWTDVDINLDMSIMLEGAYNGTDMNTDLNTLGLIPFSQPYNSISTADWYYTGTESVGSIPANVVDWVLVQIRDASDAGSADAGTVVAEQAAFVLNDGSIVDLDGSSNLYFPGIAYSSGLFPVVWHRNHLGVISANKITRSGGVYTYDFTASGSAYSNTNAGEKDLGGGVYGLFGGDGNGSGWTTYNGDDLSWWKNQAGESNDYFETDYNLDGYVDNKDKNDVLNYNQDFFSQIPGSKSSGKTIDE